MKKLKFISTVENTFFVSIYIVLKWRNFCLTKTMCIDLNKIRGEFKIGEKVKGMYLSR